MDTNKQLIDSGAVIGYRPNLKYEKGNKNISNVSATIVGDNTTQSASTNTIKSFMRDLPHSVINNLKEEIQNIDNTIERLINTFSEKEYGAYSNIRAFLDALKSNNEKLVNEFLQNHKTDISKSQIPEIIYLLYSEKNRLTMISNTLKTMYYGNKNLTDEEYKQIDTDILSVLLDKDKKQKGINYLAISNDSLLNNSINTYIYKVDDACIRLEEIAYIDTENEIVNDIIPMIENIFKEVDDSINARTNLYEMQQSVDTMEKALYNYYIRRKELKTFYDAVTQNVTEGSYLLSKISSFEKELDEAIENVNKTMLGNVYYMNSLETLMTEKQELRRVYATNSYT